MTVMINLFVFIYKFSEALTLLIYHLLNSTLKLYQMRDIPTHSFVNPL